MTLESGECVGWVSTCRAWLTGTGKQVMVPTRKVRPVTSESDGHVADKHCLTFGTDVRWTFQVAQQRTGAAQAGPLRTGVGDCC